MTSSRRSPIPAVPIDLHDLDADRINKKLDSIATRRKRTAHARRPY
jgi:hypothetical protein